MPKISIVSIAFDGYEKYIDEFIKKHESFSDDIIIDTSRNATMGEMRQRSMEKARHDYIINIDIDDEIISVPDTFYDFVGLNWIERMSEKSFWLPGEKRSENLTIRSNFMVSKKISEAVKIPSKDFYIYDYISRLYSFGVNFARTNNTCISYNRHNESLSSKPDTELRNMAHIDLKRLDKLVR
jgi:hypothetical protein